MKQTIWLNPNKMLFESEHKTFNQQVKCISRGNVFGDTQLSGYIRPFNEVECNGRTFPPGRLQEYDLEWLNKYLPEELKDWVREHGKENDLIGYTFFYYQPRKRIDVGYVITTPDGKLLKKVYARNNSKTISALDECVKYITEEE